MWKHDRVTVGSTCLHRKIRHTLMYRSRKSQRKYDVSMQGYIEIGKIPMTIPKTIRKFPNCFRNCHRNLATIIFPRFPAPIHQDVSYYFLWCVGLSRLCQVCKSIKTDQAPYQHNREHYWCKANCIFTYGQYCCSTLDNWYSTSLVKYTVVMLQATEKIIIMLPSRSVMLKIHKQVNFIGFCIYRLA